ncbi:DNA polymerase III subunit beta [Desulfovirgula thermocuniculi]|uniref:DNA polymerase III subunit beta n=1 Tax=Desulfovirgula thermocuniculi TaxID=348842 RepID=UPI00042389FF|nr:DNA polymerase III subunit beta [Desulfovirgula thermocuniculi]
MDLTIERKSLEKIVEATQRVAAKNSPQPAFSHLLLEARGGTLLATASDGEVWLRVAAPAEVAGEGTAAPPAHLLAGLVRRLPDGPVGLRSGPDGATLHVAYGPSGAALRGLDPEMYPPFPEHNGGEARFSVDGGALGKALRRVLFAASTDLARPALNGALVRRAGGGLRLAATDTFRLAECRLDVDDGDGTPEGADAIVPLRALKEVQRLASGGVEGAVEAAAGEGYIYFRLPGGAELYARLIAGRFPNYEEVIPSDFATAARLGAGELLAAVERAGMLVENDPLSPPLVALSFGEGRCTVAARTQIGELREELRATVEGEPVEVWFNWRWLAEGLRAVGDGGIFLGLNGPLGAAVFRPEGGEEGQAYTYVLLPAKPPGEW